MQYTVCRRSWRQLCLFWCWACLQKEQMLNVSMKLIHLWLYYNINVLIFFAFSVRCTACERTLQNSWYVYFLFCQKKVPFQGIWRRDTIFSNCVTVNVLPILCLILKIAEIKNLWPVPIISFSPFQTLHLGVSVGACWAPNLPATQVQRWDYGILYLK